MVFIYYLAFLCLFINFFYDILLIYLLTKIKFYLYTGTHPEILDLQVKFRSRHNQAGSGKNLNGAVQKDLRGQLQSGRFRKKPERNRSIGLAFMFSSSFFVISSKSLNFENPSRLPG